MMKTKGHTMKTTTICGKAIQHDASGQGHDWRWVVDGSIPADTLEDIAACILDGGVGSCVCWVADGGQHYRW